MSGGRRLGASSRLEKERDKLIQERLQVLLSSLLRDEDNKYCVDCDAKGPRWASWNLGLFLCIRCAGIHRNLGVHISKVKSVNLDSWTPHQVASMQAMGNSRARAVFEANLPEDFRRPQTESSLETFIRAKYEKKKYIAKEWVPSKAPDFPEGWTQLIEAEKQKKDIKQIRLPSHSLPPPPKTNTPQPTPRPPGSSAADLLALSSAKGNELVSNNAAPTSNSTADLIGIGEPATDGGNNGFDAFAPVAENTNNPVVVAANDLKKSEDDFFNSPVTAASSADSSKKMSNDSIMALFGQGNSNVSSSAAFGNAPANFMQGFNNANVAGHPPANGFGNGFNMGAPHTNGGNNPFMATAGDKGTANQVMNQFNGLNLGGGSSNGLMSSAPPPGKAAAGSDALANLDMWNGF